MKSKYCSTERHLQYQRVRLNDHLRVNPQLHNDNSHILAREFRERQLPKLKMDIELRRTDRYSAQIYKNYFNLSVILGEIKSRRLLPQGIKGRSIKSNVMNITKVTGLPEESKERFDVTSQRIFLKNPQLKRRMFDTTCHLDVAHQQRKSIRKRTSLVGKTLQGRRICQPLRTIVSFDLTKCTPWRMHQDTDNTPNSRNVFQ